MVVYSYKDLVFIGVVSKERLFLGCIETVARVTPSLHNIQVKRGRRIFFQNEPYSATNKNYYPSFEDICSK